MSVVSDDVDVILQCKDGNVLFPKSRFVLYSPLFNSLLTSLEDDFEFPESYLPQDEQTESVKENLNKIPAVQSRIIQVLDLSIFEHSPVNSLAYLMINNELQYFNDLSDLEAMLKLCDVFEIDVSDLNIENWSQITDEICVNKIAKAFSIAESLSEKYKDISDTLKLNCLETARKNLFTGEEILNFFINNEKNIDAVVKIIKHLKDDLEVTTRFEIEDTSQIEKVTLKSRVIIQNLDITVSVLDLDKETIKCCGNELKFKVKHKMMDLPSNFTYKKWTFTANLPHKIELSNKTRKEIISEELELFFYPEVSDGEKKIIREHKKDHQGPCAPEDGSLKLEFTVKVFGTGDMADIIERSPVTFGDPIPIESLPAIQIIQDGADDYPIMISCNGEIINTIYKSILVKFSNYFEASLSEKWINGGHTEDCHCQRKEDKSYETVEKIDIEGDDPVAVKILFEYCLGYPYLLKECSDYGRLCEVIRLVDFYDMNVNTKPIVERLEKVSVDHVTTDNVINLFEGAKKVTFIQAYSTLGENLQMTCIEFITNICQRQIFLDFILKCHELNRVEKLRSLFLRVKDCIQKCNVKPFDQQ